MTASPLRRTHKNRKKHTQTFISTRFFCFLSSFEKSLHILAGINFGFMTRYANILNDDGYKVQGLPQVYTDAVQVIKKAILDSQYKTARMANGEQLSLYFGIGRYVSVNSRRGTWGTSAIAHISGQLKKELPGLRGFSETSIKLMRQFYESWVVLLNRQPRLTIYRLASSTRRH